MLEKLHIAPECDGFLFLAESVRNPPTLRAHCHVELELNLVKSGSIRYVVDDRVYHFPRGSLVWLFPNQVHRLVERTPDAAYFVAVFRPRMIRQCCRTKRYAPLHQSASPGGVLHHPLPEHQLRELVNMLEELTRDGLDADILNREAGFGLTPGFQYRHGDPDALNAGLRYFLLSAWRMQRPVLESPPPRSLHPSVLRALSQLGEETSPDSLPGLASACGTTPSTLSRVFKRDMGMPISKYRNAIRLARFMRLWTEGRDATILDCMHQSGFGSYPQFYRVFKEVYGGNPKQVLRSRSSV